ncbi:MAG: hypothetical protein AUH29_08895 [Candidatus Rokubacteria bacterium 13_1_40CM_69_27]|nr:MAG: hypothetical protein AUH29_08895 [Candidatus Rokubacteria bacterium 13_1_40CM_69_27]
MAGGGPIVRSANLGTELRAGLTAFMVMAYIIFVNPLILGFAGVPGLEGKGRSPTGSEAAS